MPLYHPDYTRSKVLVDRLAGRIEIKLLSRKPLYAKTEQTMQIASIADKRRFRKLGLLSFNPTTTSLDSRFFKLAPTYIFYFVLED